MVIADKTEDSLYVVCEYRHNRYIPNSVILNGGGFMSIDIQHVLELIGVFAASSGFWAFLSRRFDKKDLKTRMLIGLGHDRITYLGMEYIERGSITQEEYENLYEYLYKPYSDMGGNGSAKRIMEEVQRLPIKKSKYGDD